MEQVEINSGLSDYSRVPIILLVDNSASMKEEGKIDILNNALIGFKQFIEEDEILHKRAEVCVVACGNRVAITHDFSPIHDFEPPIFQADGHSLMGAGILKASALLLSRQYFYKKNAIEYLQPLIYLIGGASPDDFSIVDYAGDADRYKIQAAIEDDIRQERYKLFTIAPPSMQHFSFALPLELSRKELISKDLKITEYSYDPCLKDGWGYIESEMSSSVLTDRPNADKQPMKYNILGASMIGPLHIIKGIPCQDAYAYEILPSGHAIITVADGLGSAEMSEIGSRIAVCAAIRSIREKQQEELENIELNLLAWDSVVAAREAIEKKAALLQCNLRDLACTFISVVIHEDSIVVAHIGDGAVVAKKGADLFVVSEPGDSEYANEVTPLSSKKWEASLRVTPVYSGISGVMAFSDGLQRAALRKSDDRRIPYKAFCGPLFSFAEEITDLQEGEKELKEFLSSKKMSDHSEDDKTLVFVTLMNNKQEINQ